MRIPDIEPGCRKSKYVLLESREAIRQILNRHRTHPLPEDWLPLAGFCDACGQDEVDFCWPGDWKVEYRCRNCEHEASVDLREGGNINRSLLVLGQVISKLSDGSSEHIPYRGQYWVRQVLVTWVGLTWIWRVPRLVGRYCSYLLPKHDGGTFQI